jgi:hypothetical protein
VCCQLSEEELFILNMLYQGRNLAPWRGENSKKIKRIYGKKPFSKDFDDTIQTLLNEGYVTQIKKKDIKYYISNINKATLALAAHGFDISMGKVRPIK